LSTINKLRNCSVTLLFWDLHMERASVGNLSFELEVTSDAAGDRDITSIECEPTTEEAENVLEVLRARGGYMAVSVCRRRGV
jgi:hypothetical protein